MNNVPSACMSKVSNLLNALSNDLLFSKIRKHFDPKFGHYIVHVRSLLITVNRLGPDEDAIVWKLSRECNSTENCNAINKNKVYTK
jgi:hypothetical protein